MIADIFKNSPNLERETISETEALLSRFSSLSDIEQDRERATYVSTIFPLLFGKDSVVQGSNGYESQRQAPWSTNCWLQPCVIVSPGSAQQVATALALCRFFNMKFSIRSGGHLQNPGFTSNHGGVVISLSALKQLELSEDKSTVGLGPGLKWLDVYGGLDAHGVTVTGGRVTTVVLANSQIVNANAHENADLFWALKGGGPNFGVITKLDMMTIPSKHWSEVRVYPITATDQILEAMMQYHAAIEADDKSSLIYNATHEVILLVFFYGEPVEHPPIFQSFYDIPHVATFVAPGIRTVYDLMKAVDSVQDPGPALHDFRTMTSLPSLEVYRAIVKTHAEQVDVLEDVEGLTLTTVIQPMSSSAMKATLKSPLGLSPVGQQWFLVRADWKNAKDEERVREAVRKIVDVAETEAKQAGVHLPYLYSNYASRDQDPLASYGVENAKRLKEIALKYDPDGVFQKLQNGGWLLSNMGLEA
ncbi:FAD binding domain protein [Aspergillus parasiticus SU-1]|uniref:FAD binding domain protein n=1 Tax=Aspergillus parasiticus (strain ATCC 56775 / NRRL 5862 / SRRC 143 / SU-1) TaxID=1403190 RepID=A0A0F0IRK1_ASPPU|nr:FAD binding domain protein [Aspergillus parasiticus SU-1]